MSEKRYFIDLNGDLMYYYKQPIDTSAGAWNEVITYKERDYE